MIPVRDVMPAAVADILRKAPLGPEKVALAWRLAVGHAVDRATTIELHDGVLRVRAAEPSWLREIERSAGLIRSRLQRLLGEEIVRIIQVSPPRR